MTYYEFICLKYDYSQLLKFSVPKDLTYPWSRIHPLQEYLTFQDMYLKELMTVDVDILYKSDIFKDTLIERYKKLMAAYEFFMETHPYYGSPIRFTYGTKT